MGRPGGGRGRGRGGRADKDGDVSMRSDTKSNGVGKRRNRTDTDGDVSMGSSGARGGRRGGRGAATAGPSRGGIKKGMTEKKRRLDTTAIRKHIEGEKDRPTATLREVSNDAAHSKLDEVVVRGIENSKAFTNSDKGLSTLVNFLQRKSDRDVKKFRMDDKNNVILSVKPADTPFFTKLNGFTFASAEINVEVRNKANEVSSETQAMKEKFMKLLNSRFDPVRKLLKLSFLSENGEFGDEMFTEARGPVFFRALMTVCDEAFTSAEQKRESVESVALDRNAIANVSIISDLARTFPDLRNLDLSSNQIKKVSDLDGFRRKFKSLELLQLDGNPIVANEPTYQSVIKQWFPCLRIIDGVEIRTVAEVNAEKLKRSKISFNILLPIFNDVNDLGANFVKQFFAGWDNNRKQIVDAYYDQHSSFSVNVNPSDASPASGFTPNTDVWVGKSRNLHKVQQLVTRQNRLFRGAEKIATAFAELPETRHPDFDNNLNKWCIEGHMVPCLPDPTGEHPHGLNGMMLIIHGEFDELRGDGAIKVQRSFDRVFILGPSSTPAAIRVINDMLTVRVHSSPDAWQPQENSLSETAPLAMAMEMQVPPGYGEASPDKPEDQLKKEYLEVELMKATRLTLSYARQCLEAASYIPEKAIQVFTEAKPNLAAEAYF